MGAMFGILAAIAGVFTLTLTLAAVRTRTA